MKKDKLKTVAVPVMLKEAEQTGLISEETLQAIEHEKLLAKEKIEQLRKLYKEKIISHGQLKHGIKSVEQELKYRLELLDIT